MSNIDIIRNAFKKSSGATKTTPEKKPVSDFENRILNMRKPSKDEFSLDADEVSAVIDSYIVGEEIPVSYNTDEEVIINQIRDTTGKLSEKVQAIMDEKRCSVVPFEAIGVLPQVVSFRDHDIFTLDGYRFVMSRKPRMTVMNEFKSQIISVLESGVPYKKNLMTDVLIGTQSYPTLSMSECEWSYLCSVFRRYNAKLIHSKEGQLMLMIG